MIISQSPLQQREYTDRNGQQQVFSSVGFELKSGNDRFYAELTGEQAVKCTALPQNYYYKIEMRARTRRWQDQQGKEHIDQTLTILNIETL